MIGGLLESFYSLVIGGSKGSQGMDTQGPNSFNFHAVFGEIWQNSLLEPPQGNP